MSPLGGGLDPTLYDFEIQTLGGEAFDLQVSKEGSADYKRC